MDPFLKPIKSVRPSGLTVITMRTGHEGLTAGEIRIGVGAAHGAQIKPGWLGLPHFMEHMILYGASRKYAPDEAKQLLRNKFFTDPNAWTSREETRHFATNTPAGSEGFVLPSRNFWQAFETSIDGVYFPRFDSPTMERERERIIEEIARAHTPLHKDNIKFFATMFGASHLNQHTLGTPEQVRSYSAQDCLDIHRMAYGLNNTCISVVGDVDHSQVVDKVESILHDVHPGSLPMKPFDRSDVCAGEFRRQKDDANEGSAEIELFFQAPNLNDPQYYAAIAANNALSNIIEDKVKDKYGLYVADMNYHGWATNTPAVMLRLTTGRKDKIKDATQYALEILQEHATRDLLASRHWSSVEYQATQQEINQTTIQQHASFLNSVQAIGAPLLSRQEIIDNFRKVTAADMIAVLEGLNSSPMFLNIRGHKDALDILPSIDVVDSWRAAPAGQPKARQRAQPAGEPPLV